MNTSEANPTTITAPPAPDVAEEHAAPQPPHGVALGRLAFILAVLILIGAIAGFVPRLRQRVMDARLPPI